MSDALTLIQQAVVALKGTTVGYVNKSWKIPPPGSKWDVALSDLAQAETLLATGSVPVPAGAKLILDLGTVAAWPGGVANSDSTVAGSVVDEPPRIRYWVPGHTGGLAREELDQGGNASTGAGSIMYGGHYWIEFATTVDPASDLAGVPPAQGGVNVAQMHAFYDAAALNLFRLYRDVAGGPLYLRAYVSGGAQSGSVYAVRHEATVEQVIPGKEYFFQVEMIARGDSSALYVCYCNGKKLDFGAGTDHLPCASTEGGGRHQRLRNGIYYPGKASGQIIVHGRAAKVYSLS